MHIIFIILIGFVVGLVARWRLLPEPPGVPKDRYFLYRVA